MLFDFKKQKNVHDYQSCGLYCINVAQVINVIKILIVFDCDDHYLIKFAKKYLIIILRQSFSV